MARSISSLWITVGIVPGTEKAQCFYVGYDFKKADEARLAAPAEFHSGVLPHGIAPLKSRRPIVIAPVVTKTQTAQKSKK